MKNKRKRLEKYNRLRKAGYNSRQANRYKDLTQAKVDELIQIMEKVKHDQAKIVLGGRKQYE